MKEVIYTKCKYYLQLAQSKYYLNLYTVKKYCWFNLKNEVTWLP